MNIYKTDANRRLVVTSDKKNIVEFIHVYNADGKKIALVTLWNLEANGETRIDFDTPVTLKALKESQESE